MPTLSRESAYSVTVTSIRLQSFLKSKAFTAIPNVRVWQEPDGTVWAGYDDVMPDQREAIEAAVKYAIAPY